MIFILDNSHNINYLGIHTVLVIEVSCKYSELYAAFTHSVSECTPN